MIPIRRRIGKMVDKVTPAVLVKVTRLVKAPPVAIVDDDDDLREALSDLLQVLGLSCRSFARAELLLAEYRTGAFACIVTDIKMPGVNGLELLRRLRGFDASVPVIVITSDTDPKTCLQALSHGALACLTKPVEDHVLLSHLERALARDDLLSGGKPQ